MFLRYVFEVYMCLVGHLDKFFNLCRHVSRVANTKEDDLEALYEKRLRKKTLENEEKKGIEVDRVDALPVKTLDGKLYYKTGLQSKLTFSWGGLEVIAVAIVTNMLTQFSPKRSKKI